MPRRLRQIGVQEPISENGIAEGAGPQPNTKLQQACEQYIKRMAQSGGSLGGSVPGMPMTVPRSTTASRRYDVYPGREDLLSAEASLRSTAKWNSIIIQYSVWSQKAVVLAGRLLLSYSRSSKPLTLHEERLVTHLFLRDPEWVAVFPELAKRCQDQIAARLRVEPGIEGQLAVVRLAANPRRACALAELRPGCSNHSRPMLCSLASKLPSEPVSMEVADAAELVVADDDMPPGLQPQMHGWIPHFQTMDSLPESPPDRRRSDDPHRVMTMDSIASYADLAGMNGLQTLDSLPDMMEPETGNPMYFPTADSLPDIVQTVGRPMGPMGDRSPNSAPAYPGALHMNPSFFAQYPAGYGARPPFGLGAQFRT